MLSTKGWNNVLIFGTLLMIALFNGLHKRWLGDGQNAHWQVVQAEQSLLRIDYPHLRIQRIANAFRSQPMIANPEQHLQFWQQLQLTELTTDAVSDAPLVIDFYPQGQPPVTVLLSVRADSSRWILQPQLAPELHFVLIAPDWLQASLAAAR